MKRLYTLLLILMGCQMASVAQTQELFASYHPLVREKVLNAYNAPSTAGKAEQALNSRLKAIKQVRWTAGSWQDEDSSSYKYTGTRGGTFDLDAAYDTLLALESNGTVWEDDFLHVKTYNANNQKLTHFVYTYTGGTFVGNSRELNTYDASGNLLESTNSSWIGGAWDIAGRYTYTYDANGNILTLIYESKFGGVLTFTGRYTYTYNAQNLETVEVSEIYDSGNWVNYERTNTVYNANNKLQTETTEEWDGTAWEFASKNEYTYTGNGDVATTERLTYNGTAWVGSQRSTYTYDGQNRLIRRVSEYVQLGSYVYNTKDSLVYGNGFVVEDLRYQWDNGTWETQSRQVITRDANGNMTYVENFSGQNNTWELFNKEFKKYNTFNQLTSDSLQYDNGSGLENDIWRLYYYETYEDGSNGITTIPTLSSTVMPNPFTINVAIQVNVAEAGNHTFEVYNMAGQRVHSESRHLAPGQQTIIWEGADMPKGVYFYKINSQSGVASGKLMKQ